MSFKKPTRMLPKKALTALFAAGLMFGAPALLMPSTITAEAQINDAKKIVDQAKSDQLLGESASGYLVTVTDSIPQDVLDAMNEINIGRKALFTRKAREQNVQTEVIAQLTGEKLIANAAPGQRVRGSDGNWTTK